MDLAIGAKQVFVLMEHRTRSGKSKIVRECTMPLTGFACVSRIYTDLGVFDVIPQGLLVRELFGNSSLAEVQAVTGVPLRS